MLDSAFQQIQTLSHNFKANERYYLSSTYDEASARKDFIDKFFIALGWDVNHDTQTNPYEQEVRIENRVNMKGSIGRRADYAFFLAPNFREEDVAFFVEAKKPSRSLANKDDYYQTIRYGWNRGTPVSVLTDFEEFHIIDCRSKPDLNTALNRKLASYHYTDFASQEKFREVWHLFSRQSVADGSLDRYAASLPKPKGKAAIGLPSGGFKPVDESFLETLDGYRETLARAFKKRNPTLDGQALTEAVQRTLDRVVFIRFLEDRAIEETRMKEFGAGKGTAWDDFIAYSHALDLKYNGMLFKQHLLIDAPTFIPPDESVFRGIIQELTNPTNPYNFDQIPISILGSIYERFLGKVITVTAKRAAVEERPEVKKAGGVFYTPDYIVRYIVQETIGQQLGDPANGGKTPAEIERMSFADIACGSGSFLIEVYAALLEYHERWYAANPSKAGKDDLAIREGTPKLTIQRRQSILLNNVFGVDIDFQATEVTQLSLYLKLLEGVTMEEADTFAQRRRQLLPDLRKNIVCGNSIVETDYWGVLNAEANNPIEERRVNALDYADAFPTVMKRGGFDAVVGNPPYVRQETLGEGFKRYVKGGYKVYHGTADLYAYFIERGVNVLRAGGEFGIIVANKWMRANYGKPLRSWLKGQRITRLIDFGDLPVFQSATTYPCILFINKAAPEETFPAANLKSLAFDSLAEEVESASFRVRVSGLDDGGWTLTNETKQDLLKKLRAVGVPLEEYVGGNIFYGIKTGLNEAFVISAEVKERLITEDPRSAEVIKPFLLGREVKRYQEPKPKNFLLFIPWHFPLHNDPTISGASYKAEIAFKKDYPAVYRHLEQFKKELSNRNKTETGIRYEWYALQRCAATYYKEFEKPKIIYPNICKRPEFTFDDDHQYTNQKCFIISLNDLYLVGVLNSNVHHYLFSVILPKLRGDYYEPSYVFFKDFPIPVLNLQNKEEREQHETIVRLVQQRMDLQQRFDTAISEHDRERIERSINKAEREINAVVYELYGLTEEEIAIVEGVAAGL